MKWDAALYDAAQGDRRSSGMDLMDLSGIRNSDVILDIGCGTGTLTFELARRAESGFVVGIDPSAEMLARAKAKSASYSNIELMLTAAEEMEFTDRFDLVFSNLALQWVKEQGKALKRMFLSLRQGGRIAVHIPAREFSMAFFENINGVVSDLRIERFYSAWEFPWYLPDKEEYVELLTAAGFRNVDVSCKCFRTVFTGTGELMNWLVSAGLRPYLSVLPEREQEYLKYAIAMRFENSRTDNGIELEFRRLFAFAEK